MCSCGCTQQVWVHVSYMGQLYACGVDVVSLCDGRRDMWQDVHTVMHGFVGVMDETVVRVRVGAGTCMSMYPPVLRRWPVSALIFPCTPFSLLSTCCLSHSFGSTVSQVCCAVSFTSLCWLGCAVCGAASQPCAWLHLLQCPLLTPAYSPWNEGCIKRV